MQYAMLCAIYKSIKKNETYLYVPKRDDFSRVPEPLMQMFGTPSLVMLFDLNGNKPLIRADKQEVQNKLKEQGYYLQMPPPQESLLTAHKKSMGAEE